MLELKLWIPAVFTCQSWRTLNSSGKLPRWSWMLFSVLRPGTDTPFSPTAFNNLVTREGGSSKNSIVLDEKEDEENFSSTFLASEFPTEPPLMLRSPLFGTRNANVPAFVCRTLFEYLYCLRVCNIISIYLKCFINITCFFSNCLHMFGIKTVHFGSTFSGSQFMHIRSPYREKKGEHRKKNKKSPSETEYKGSCLDGDRHHLLYEEYAGCK